MFDIGFQELVLIGLLALIVLGPRRLPEAARTAGRWVGKARGFVSNIKQDLNRELQSHDLAEFRRLQEELAAARNMLRESSSNVVNDIKAGIDEAKSNSDSYLVKAQPEAAAARTKKPKTVKKAKTGRTAVKAQKKQSAGGRKPKSGGTRKKGAGKTGSAAATRKKGAGKTGSGRRRSRA
jgi:sec-independent protein translocase protein TatB